MSPGRGTPKRGVDKLLVQEATLTLRAPGGPADEYGNPSAIETTLALDVALQRTTGDEPIPHDGAIQRTRWRAFLPAGTPVDGWAKLTVDGLDYELAADPYPVRSLLRDEPSHVEADLVRVR